MGTKNESSEVKEEFPACKMKDVYLFRDRRGNAESISLQGQNVEGFQNLVYKHRANSDKSTKGPQKGPLVKVVGNSCFEVPDEGRVLGGAAPCEVTAFQPEMGSGD